MTETYQQKIGRTVRKYRKDKEMSQQELADKVNISRSYLSEIESGKVNASFQVMSRIMNELTDKKFWIEKEVDIE